jgi:hypothetical protein
MGLGGTSESFLVNYFSSSERSVGLTIEQCHSYTRIAEYSSQGTGWLEKDVVIISFNWEH